MTFHALKILHNEYDPLEKSEKGTVQSRFFLTFYFLDVEICGTSPTCKKYTDKAKPIHDVANTYVVIYPELCKPLSGNPHTAILHLRKYLMF